MANKKYIAIISEGKSSEEKVMGSVKKNFFNTTEDIVFLPFGAEIYQLWNKIKDDSYLDIIELLIDRDETGESEQKVKEIGGKEEISLIYLLFDFDGQSTSNYGDYSKEEIVLSMLKVFDNETENGKIFISYPMVEAMRDLTKDDICSRRCSVKAYENIKFKTKVAEISCFTSITSYKITQWYYLTGFAVKKSCCIVLSKFEFIEYKKYRELINQMNIFINQVDKFLPSGEIATLGSIPLLLVDYFGEKLYDEILKSYIENDEYSIKSDEKCNLC